MGDASLPERIGKYRILKLLGKGGMGSVFEAEQDSPRRTVALKVLHAGILSEEMRRRFELEAQVLGLLQHACIAQIHEAGMYESAGGAQPYFAMERIRGVPLTEYAEAQDLNTRARLELIARICDGVQHAHQRGVIHRDLKPANILVDEAGQPKILDFGLARATDADLQAATLHTDIGQIMGTIPYMSPEQAAGDPLALDFRSDIYSLGVVAYQLVSGFMPYQAGGPLVLENLRAVRETDAAPLSSIQRSLRGDVETIIGKALEKVPARRYASAADFAADIRRHLDDQPIRARPPSALYQLAKFTRRNRALVLGTAAVFVALMIGLIGTARGFLRARGEAEKARAEAERATRTADFFQAILLGIDPAVAQGSDTTLLKQIFDDTAARVESELSDLPLVEASLRDTMASAYFAISEHAAGLEQARRALDLYQREAGPRSEGALRAQRKVGTLLTKIGSYDEAERVFDENLALASEVYGPGAIETLTVRNELAILHLTLERSDLAAEEFGELLAARRRVLGDDDPDTLITLSCLGLALLQQHHDEQGLEVLREVLAARERVSGETHPDTIKAAHNLAGALGSVGHLAEAEALYRQSLERDRRILGPEHDVTLAIQQNLAVQLRHSGRSDEAVALQEEVLEAVRRRYGPEDRRTFDAEQSLALDYKGAGRVEEGLALMRHAYPGFLGLYGEEHPQTLDALSSLVSLLSNGGYAEEAAALRETCVELHRRVLGDEHEDTLIVRHDQGYALMRQGRLEQAEQLLREVLATSRRVLGDTRPGTLRTLMVLSAVLQHQRRYAESVPLMGEFLVQWSRIYGDLDSKCAEVAGALSEGISRLDELGPCEPAVRALAAYHERTLEAGAQQLVLEALWLAEAQEDLGRHAEAIAGFEAAFERFGEGSLTARAQGAYGAALAGEQRFDEGQDMLLMAYDGAQLPVERRRIAQRLAALYEAWGNPDEAAAWRERASE